MKRVRQTLGVGVLTAALVASGLCSTGVASATLTPVGPQLTINELNITGDEFVVLQNKGDAPAELNTYWLGYTSDTDATAAPEQRLPNQELQPGEVLALTNGPLASCGASYVANLAFSLSNSSGALSLWQFAGSARVATFSFVSSVNWGKARPTDAGYLNMNDEKLVDDYDTQVAIVPLPPTVWYKGALSSHPNQVPHWQVGYLQTCQFTPVVGATASEPAQPISWQSSASGPPFVMAATVITGQQANLPVIPASDRGLKGLQLSEILPNPASPQTDAADEFIELYNPNGHRFDMSNFMLQIASATSAATHTYHFPAGTTIAPGSFKAFKSAQTHLGLNNSGGQVWLVDPLGNTVTSSQPYGTAKDGRAWVNAAGKWQWTALATPNATNKVAGAVSASSSQKTATVKGKKVVTVAGSGGGTVAGASTGATAAAATTLPIHPWTLAIIAVAALLYGAYEYRYDLANRIHEFRRNRAARR